MKIATYNLLKGGSKRVHWQRLLHEQQVDLLLVQESFPPEQHLSADDWPQFKKLSRWAPAGENRWGSAIFSTSGRLVAQEVVGYAGWVSAAKLARADWQTARQSILVFSIHVPAGAGSYRGQFNKILDAIATLTDTKEIILGGDFNLSISDSSRSTRPVHKGDLEIQSRLAEQFGLINCWQTANPRLPPPQTLRWSGNRKTPYHCDGIFVPKSWAQRLVSCDVLSDPSWDELSDHNPVVAEFV